MRIFFFTHAKNKEEILNINFLKIILAGITENGISSSYEIDLDYDLYYNSYYSGSFIQSISNNGIVYNCLSNCNANSLCSLFVVKAGNCYFYRKLNRVYVKTSTGTRIYSRRISG